MGTYRQRQAFYLYPYLRPPCPLQLQFTVWHGIVTMIASVVLCSTDTMSVEGPHTSIPFPEFQSSRPNARSTKASRGVEVAYTPQQQYKPMKRSSPFTAGDSSMPASTSSQSLLASIPSFMSVFGNGSDRLPPNQPPNDAKTLSTEAPGTTIKFSRIPNTFASPIHRRDSTSTFESVDSSPTTTISTIESSLTEPSPSSPPESPESLLPYTSFKNLRTSSVPGRGIMDDNDCKDRFSSSFPTLPGVDRADSPNKKMRNMKNLSVNTSTSNRNAQQLPKLGLSSQSGASHAVSAPPTPGFIVPTQAPRRKPSQLGLSITTPEASSSIQPTQERPSAVPATPSDPQIRTLRHLQTSSNGALFSPTVAPEGGMRLPPFSNPPSNSRFGKSGPPLAVSPRGSVDNTIGSPITRQTLDHVQEETDYDVPLSQEVKSPAYPRGPVCIYDPLVYLYLEPSHIEARQFDVILNVAREVKNPFKAALEEVAGQQGQIAEVQAVFQHPNAGFAGRDSISEPQTASSDKTFSSAFEVQPDDAIKSAPSTPKATRPEPEYVHMPWDHNTNVVDDLLKLCELVDSRVRQGKRVLVHCQCGVSRSASLVVAYGLYKNPQLTVQEAYDAVKNRSRWIGPNMNLIYQLSEFKSKLPKPHTTGTVAWHSWKSLGSGRSNPNATLRPDAGPVLPSSSLRTPPPKSLSDPSYSGGRDPSIGRANSFSPPGSAQLVQPSNGGDITPGPSSAPPDMQWSPERLPSNKNSDDGMATDGLSPPRMIDLDTDMMLSPSSISGEGIEEKEIAPAGGVAKDLQEVAKDLNSSDHGSITMSPPDPHEVDVDGHNFLLLSPPRAMEIDNTKPVLTRFSSSRAMDMDTDDPVSPTSTTPVAKAPENTFQPLQPVPSPTLPAGFSSLLYRRQAPLGLQQMPLGLDRLPLRSPEPPCPASVLPPQSIDPDVPSTPSILSPRAAEFTASPFHRTVAGDLAGSSVFEQGLMSPRAVEEDPRSPHQKGEAEVTRSIFDMI